MQRHRFRYDSVALRGVPAHVTVLFPFVPPDEMSEAAENLVGEILAPFSAFSFSLSRIERFPEGALYLALEPADAFVRLTEAFADGFPAYPPYGGAHAEVIPHLTVAQTPDMLTEEIAEISDRLPIECVAREIWLMVESDDHRWRTEAIYSLDGERR